MPRNPRRNGRKPEAPPPPPESPPRQVIMSPERQMIVRIWSLEDLVAELQQQNAELQTALARATARPEMEKG